LSAGELCRKYGISDATFYKWRSRYGGMEVSDARKLKARLVGLHPKTCRYVTKRTVSGSLSAGR
jgi:transposase-like protein